MADQPMTLFLRIIRDEDAIKTLREDAAAYEALAARKRREANEIERLLELARIRG